MNMKKNILILTDAFAEPAYNPRVRCLCDNLMKMGWNPFLLTEKIKGQEYKGLPCPNRQVAYYYYNTGLSSKIEWMLKFLAGILFDYKNRYYYKTLCRECKDMSFDVVLCSSFHTFPMPAAFQFAAKRKIPLYVDLRDLAEQCPGGEYNEHRFNAFPRLYALVNACFRDINIKRRNRVIKKANAVITVSPWHKNFLSQWNNNVHLIYNGFDEKWFFPYNSVTPTFQIVYTGKIYGQTMQDPTLFFEAMSQLHKELKINNDVVCNFYVNETTKNRLISLAQQYGVEDYMRYISYVSPENIPDVLHQSSIILVLANKTTENGPFGIMTTKFFEALGVEKPILCVRSDESCLADAIRETNAGLAATDVEDVKAFILEKYEEWKRNGYTHQQVNAEKKQLFSRQFQAKQFVQIFEKCL